MTSHWSTCSMCKTAQVPTPGRCYDCARKLNPRLPERTVQPKSHWKVAKSKDWLRMKAKEEA